MQQSLTMALVGLEMTGDLEVFVNWFCLQTEQFVSSFSVPGLFY